MPLALIEVTVQGRKFLYLQSDLEALRINKAHDSYMDSCWSPTNTHISMAIKLSMREAFGMDVKYDVSHNHVYTVTNKGNPFTVEILACQLFTTDPSRLDIKMLGILSPEVNRTFDCREASRTPANKEGHDWISMVVRITDTESGKSMESTVLVMVDQMPLGEDIYNELEYIASKFKTDGNAVNFLGFLKK